MLGSNKNTNFNKKNIILKHFSMYRTIHMILQYDMIYTIYTIYHTIHEHLRYADTIQIFLHTIHIMYYTILTTMLGRAEAWLSEFIEKCFKMRFFLLKFVFLFKSNKLSDLFLT